MTSAAAARYRDLVELSVDGILLQVDGRIAFANQAARRMLRSQPDVSLEGRRVDEFLGTPWLPVVHDELVEPGSTRTPFAERQLQRLDGTSLPVEVSAVPFVFDDRPSVQLVLRDIRARVEARSAMLWAESQFRVLAEQLPFVMWTTDLAARVISVVGDATSPFGIQAAHALRLNEPLPLDGARPELGDLDARLREGEHPMVEVAFKGRTYAVRIEPLRHDGAVIGRLGVAFDVTPWLRVQELVRESARVDALGTLAGGVAHEINNVLAIVAGNAALLEGVPAAADAAGEILKAARRGGEVTGDLLTFAMRDLYRPARLSVNDLVRDTVEIVLRTAPMNITVETDLKPVPDLSADRDALGRALVHLCLNGIDALAPRGGHLRIETVRASLETPGAATRDAVAIRVIDSGHGMARAVVAHAFDPFYTTRGGRRVGLGLSVAQGVARRHGGSIGITSRPMGGTIATLTLPAANGSGAATAAPPAVRDVSARPKALVVDDEPMMRRVAGLLVGPLGYEPIEARDGQEAIETFRQDPTGFAFVLLDVLMPGLTGADVLAELLTIDPDVRVVLCTGYPRDELDAALFERGAVAYLRKPFAREDLTSAIRSVVSSAATRTAR